MDALSRLLEAISVHVTVALPRPHSPRSPTSTLAVAAVLVSLSACFQSTVVMLARRFLLGASRRLAVAPVARSAPRCQRYSSTKVEQFQGAEDNEFNRERARARAHAGESGCEFNRPCAADEDRDILPLANRKLTGTCSSLGEAVPLVSHLLAIIRPRLSLASEHVEWMCAALVTAETIMPPLDPGKAVLTVLSVALPFFIVGSVNAKMRWDAHWEHERHEPPVEERTEYPYMNIRTKNFWWGDGDKVREIGLRELKTPLLVCCWILLCKCNLAQRCSRLSKDACLPPHSDAFLES